MQRKREGEVAVTSSLPGDALARLSECYSVRIRQEWKPLEPDDLAGFIGGAEAVITLLGDEVNRQVLAACSNLRIVANYAVGYNNIDLEAARDLDLWITNTPDVLTEATADLTFALMLAVTRRLREAEQLLRTGAYTGWKPDLLLGFGLQGQTLGIVGYGRIGRAVARRAEAFGMRVRYTDRQDDDRQGDDRQGDGDSTPAGSGERNLPLEQLLAHSNVLSLHCPLTAETRHLLDDRRLALLPRGAYLINTARGPLVDEAALVRALASGHLAGAGLDVFEHEPQVHPGLLDRTDVVLLPHVGSATFAARAAMADLAVANVEAVLEGRRPPTPVIEPARTR